MNLQTTARFENPYFIDLLQTFFVFGQGLVGNFIVAEQNLFTDVRVKAKKCSNLTIWKSALHSKSNWPFNAKF